MLDDDHPPTGPDEVFARELELYLVAILHAPIILNLWPRAEALPVFLNQRYGYYDARIAGRACLFMLARSAAPQTPADIAKQVAMVEQAARDHVVIFASRYLNSTLRARLIGLGVAFAVPGNQFYVPQLAMDLREHFRPPERVRGDHLSPVAQAVLFHHILNGRDQGVTPTALAEEMRYSAMSVGRAFDELAARNLARVAKRGREKTISYAAEPGELIKLSRALLRSPVRGRHGVIFSRPPPPLMLAGESALAALTDLNPPRLPTFAIAAADWTIFFGRHGIKDTNDIDEAEALIETWRYDPASLATGDVVDRLSLYARYNNDADERLAQAARRLVEEGPW
jgi:hypothetical protein